LLLFYLGVTLWGSASLLFGGNIWKGAAVLLGSTLCFAGGSGMRASVYLGQKQSGLIGGIILAVAGIALVSFSGAVLSIFEPQVSGILWVLFGFGLGLIMTRPEDAGIQTNGLSQADDLVLGILAPIAAELEAGRLTAAQAEQQVKESASIAPNAPAVWESMNAKDREELGLNFMRLAIDPEFRVQLDEKLKPLSEVDPVLWNEALNRARKELGHSQIGDESES
jgi:hypothetical protein